MERATYYCYRFKDFTPAMTLEELEAYDFTVNSLWNNLVGKE